MQTQTEGARLDALKRRQRARSAAVREKEKAGQVEWWRVASIDAMTDIATNLKRVMRGIIEADEVKRKELMRGLQEIRGDVGKLRRCADDRGMFTAEAQRAQRKKEKEEDWNHGLTRMNTDGKPKMDSRLRGNDREERI